MKRINEIIVYIISLFTVAIYTYMNSIYADFSAINGVFQNYNVVRRLLDGQIPYVDFAVYLGLGHLYIGALFTYIFGNSYIASKLVFDFLNMLSFVLVIIALSKGSFGKKSIIPAVLLLIILLIAMYGILPVYLPTTGISARYLRGMILPIVILLLFYIENSNKKYIKKYLNIIRGFILGFSFLWSNDYGISTYIAGMIVYSYYILISHNKIFDKVKEICLIVLSSIVAIFLLITISTKGHPDIWIMQTIDSGTFQRWYYKIGWGPYYICDITLIWQNILQFFIILYLAVMLYKTRKNKYLLLTIANLSTFTASILYKTISGLDLNELAIQIVYLTILIEFITLIQEIIKRKNLNNKLIKYISIIFYIIILFFVIYKMYDNLKILKEQLLYREKNFYSSYIEELDGYIHNNGLYNSIIEGKGIIGNDTLFSTYASALEIVTNQYQPSGIDYIIHVLGDKNREKYLKKFKEINPKYVLTINEEYTTWEYWIKHANWFFYREMYKSYTPKYKLLYGIIWERNDNNSNDDIIENPNVKIDIKNIENDIKVTIITDTAINGIADVNIKYMCNIVNQKKIKNLLMINHLVNVRNLKGSYSIRADNMSGENIPVYINNGVGELYLTSFPVKDTALRLNNISVEKIFLNSGIILPNYIQTSYLNDHNWTNGVLFDNKTILFDIKYLKLLEQIDTLKVNRNGIDYTAKIKEIKHIGKYVHVIIDNECAPQFAHPAYIDFTLKQNHIPLQISNITDINWVKGVLQKDKHILVMDEEYYELMKLVEKISVMDKGKLYTANIQQIKIEGNYIHVITNISDASVFAYPAKIDYELK